MLVVVKDWDGPQVRGNTVRSSDCGMSQGPKDTQYPGVVRAGVTDRVIITIGFPMITKLFNKSC